MLKLRRTILFTCVLTVGAGVAFARPGWTDPVKGMTLTCAFLDRNYIRTPCTSKGKEDHRNTWRQHLGADFRASVGATVYAPVKGKVVMVDAGASKDPALAYLVIKDSQTGEEHVLGHISSSLRRGDSVAKGAVVGYVRNQGSNTHIHWGFNLGSVEKATQRVTKCQRDGKMKNCEWGWGKAPFEATEQQVREMGWRNVL